MNQVHLKNELSYLVNNFGPDKVRNMLDTIVANPKPKSKSPVEKLVATGVVRKKPDAVAVTVSLGLCDGEKRKLLLGLAKQYDAKQFMPNINHVRDFLVSDYADPSRIKSRQQVTVRVFNRLAAMDLAKLREIDESGVYGPPKRLATYSDAILGYGRARRELHDGS